LPAACLFTRECAKPEETASNNSKNFQSQHSACKINAVVAFENNGESGSLSANPYLNIAPRERALQPAKGEITVLLGKWKDGEPSAFEDLMPLVYPHLRQVAAAYVRRERNPDVIQGTALVHELYIRLLNQKKAEWDDRRHFYTFAAKVMRMILIDHARETQTQMRGGGLERVPLSDDLSWINIDSPELLDLNRALDELGALDAYKVQLVELRYFLGCTAEETASLMNVSKATVDRDLKFIKSWLYRRIHPEGAGETTGA
jgi:RNA polymerase sigma factor (TIGR02999 family)